MHLWKLDSKKAYEHTPYHHFLGDFDEGKPPLKPGEICYESKTPGHYHVVRSFANLTIDEYAKEMFTRGVDHLQIVALEINNKIEVTIPARLHICEIIKNLKESERVSFLMMLK